MDKGSFKAKIEKKKIKVQQKFANMLEIPEDTLLSLPKITVIGNTHVYIENHMGVIEYTSCRLRVGVIYGEITITGSDFFLKNIFADELSVEGKIETIVLST